VQHACCAHNHNIAARLSVNQVDHAILQGTLVGSKVYLFGGEDAARRPQGDLFVLDLADMEWQSPEVTGEYSKESYQAAVLFTTILSMQWQHTLSRPQAIQTCSTGDAYQAVGCSRCLQALSDGSICICAAGRLQATAMYLILTGFLQSRMVVTNTFCLHSLLLFFETEKILMYQVLLIFCLQAHAHQLLGTF